MSNVEVVPSILTDSSHELVELLRISETAAKRAHIDIIDGIYAKNKTIDPSVLNDIDSIINIDFHLMVNNPVNWVEKCARASASRVIAQIEMMQIQSEFVEKVLSVGSFVGLAIDNNSSIYDLDDEVLQYLDLVLVMSVPAGFGGQQFHDSALIKIKELQEIRTKNNYKYKIAVDGGITPENSKKLIDLKVDEITVGRRLFDGDFKVNIDNYSKTH